MNASPQLDGAKSAIAPKPMMASPITGMTRTEKAPPVTIAVPYSSNQMPGSSVCTPALKQRKREQAANDDRRSKAQ